jgi:hypothetical protein
MTILARIEILQTSQHILLATIAIGAGIRAIQATFKLHGPLFELTAALHAPRNSIAPVRAMQATSKPQVFSFELAAVPKVPHGSIAPVRVFGFRLPPFWVTLPTVAVLTFVAIWVAFYYRPRPLGQPPREASRSVAPLPTWAFSNTDWRREVVQHVPHLVYSPWTKFCSTPGQNGQNANAPKVCFTGRDARTETGVPVAAAALIEPDGIPKKIFRVGPV